MYNKTVILLDTSLGFVRQAYLHAHLKLGLEQPTLIIVSIILLVECRCQQEMLLLLSSLTDLLIRIVGV